MLKVLNEFVQQYFWFIMGTFDKFWNEYNEYGIPKCIFNIM
jgi:uncharacterized protein YozE (UPF0346 family)